MWNSVEWEDAHHDWLLITSVWSYWKFHKLVFQMFLDKLKKKKTSVFLLVIVWKSEKLKIIEILNDCWVG